MRLFSVAGSPILHSKSPLLFNKLFKACSIDARYTRIGPESPEELFFLAEHLSLEGLNITSPFKESVFPFMEEWDDGARKTGSVNTVILKEGKKKGFNTDPDGVSLALINRSLEVTSKKCLVLGAGGAGKAAALALQNRGADVVILNRTVEKAAEFASRIGGQAFGLNDLPIHWKDAFVVINTIPEIKTVVKDFVPGKESVIFDAVYHSSDLESICRQAGVSFIPGEEWLLNQARRSFEIFTGNKPEVDEWDPSLLWTRDSGGAGRNVSLIGFMGCGKTSAAAALARELGYSLLDTDSEIEKQEGRSISQIFSLKGEAYFRKKEREVISRLSGTKRLVVACGGGAVLDEENRKLLRKNSIVIWLFNTAEESVRRLSGKERPLLEKNDPVEKAGRLFQERKEKYFVSSDLIISSQKNMKEVVRRAYEEVVRMF